MSPVVASVVKILRWSGVAAGTLALIALALFAVAFAINASDEPLSPQALALRRAAPSPYPEANNSYLALQGFDAPPGEAVIAAGVARIERFNRGVDGESRDPRRLDFRGNASFIHPLDGSVWSEAAAHQAEITQLLADNSELYQRYLTLIGLHAYAETARPSTLTPYPAMPHELRRLFLAAVALHLRSGFAHERELALGDLASDVRLWHVLLAADGTLLVKMLAVANLQADALLLADLVADERSVLPAGAAADALFASPDLAAWNIGTAYPAEFRIVASFMASWAEEQAHSTASGWQRAKSRIVGHFFKLNATENLLARDATRRMELAADPRRFYAAAGKGGALLEGQAAWALPLSYNPVGRVLAAASAAAYDNYPPRAWDGAALQRLVRAGYEIRRLRIERGAVADFLQQHPEIATHPASGRPFLWDAAKGELRVPTVGAQPPGRRFSIRVWPGTGGS